MRRAGACRARRWRSSGSITSSSRRSTATISTTAARAHFAATITAIRAATPTTTIEILTPDFLRKDGAIETVVAARPDVYNHNLETVPSHYLTVRPGARYFASLRLLQQVKELDPPMFTKSGIMVGLGEERNEVLQLMDDLRAADVDFLTIGQYLQPTRKHHAVMRFVHAGRVQGLRDDRLRQGLPDGVGLAADALLASCRRRFRAAEGRARRQARLRPMRRVLVIGCAGSGQDRRWRRGSPQGSACRFTISIAITGNRAGAIAMPRMRASVCGRSPTQPPGSWTGISPTHSTCACRAPTA